ncbi:MAG: hypothetical protein AB7K86_11035 [Rhodospirillales bacterium]
MAGDSGPAMSRAGALLLGVVAAALVCVAWATRDFFMDDAFIGFQFLRNMTAGHGFVFFPGAAPVEGVTNVGWLLLLAPLTMVATPEVAAKAAGGAFLVLALAQTLRLSRRAAAACDDLPFVATLLVVPVLAVALRFDFFYFALAGMETALLAALLLAMAGIAWSRPASVAAAALGGIAFLVRPEAAGVYVLYFVLLVAADRGRARSMVPPAAAFLAIVAAVTAGRILYFGDVLPNTFYSKPGTVVGQVNNLFEFLVGLNDNLPFPVSGVLALPPLAMGYVRLDRCRPSAAAMLGAIALTGLMFGLYSKQDWTGYGRYFAPYLPAAAILLWLGVLAIAAPFAAHAGARTARRFAAFAVALVTFIGAVGLVRSFLMIERYPGYVIASRSLVEPARWMHDNLPPDATIASRRIGVLAYHSHRRVFDYAYGLTERDVAHLISARGAAFTDPTDAGLAALWRRAAPRYVLEDEPVLEEIAREANGSAARFVLHGLEYRVVKRFPIGRHAVWALAARTGADSLAVAPR